MSWEKMLYDTYEFNKIRQSNDGINITPLAHMPANAQIEVELNLDGEFLGASVIPKEKAYTIIPVTEDSAGRTSGEPAPYALSDYLSYIAKDYYEYCDKNKEIEDSKEKYEKYINQLKDWCESEFSTDLICAVYKYLSKQNLINDLIKSSVVNLKNNKFDTKKINGKDYEKSLVRFVVNSIPVYKDFNCIDMYKKYYINKIEMERKKDVCYITGTKKINSYNHLKGLINTAYNAKVISTNRKQKFAFLGRFGTAEQAYSLSYEASQKIHLALIWLAKRESIVIGTKDSRTFIIWNPKGKKTIDPMNDIFGDEDDSYEYSSYKSQLNGLLSGCVQEYDESDNIAIISLDAATTGRLSITYYNEFYAKSFFDKVENWCKSLCFYFLKYNEKEQRYIRIVKSLGIKYVVKYVYGTERNGFIETDDKVLKEQSQRLVKCMLENQPFPKDMMIALYNKASNPQSYKKYANKENVLSLACAVIRKYYYDRNMINEEDYMKLDEKNNDRSYLFGRLLAIYEKIENDSRKEFEDRDTNAIRLQSAYVNHPMQTLAILKNTTVPYMSRLNSGTKIWYENLITEIMALFKEEDINSMNRKLKETYLLGYYMQRMSLYTKKEEDREDN